MSQRKSTWVFLALLVWATPWVRAQAPAGAPGTHEIQMTAKKYEFDPNLITVQKGEHVKLVITALDRDHGFKLEAFGINQVLRKGVPVTVEFTADKAGTFPFQCSKYCGFGHKQMKGTLVVEEGANP